MTRGWSPIRRRSPSQVGTNCTPIHTYVPDYVANAGGIISVSAEYLGEGAPRVAARVAQIGPRVTMILDEARHRRLSPATVADRMAERLIAERVRRVA